MGKIVSQLKQFPNKEKIKLSVSDRLRFLLNNKAKKTIAFLVIYFSILSYPDLNLIFFKMPNINQLTSSEGIIKIEKSENAKIGNVISLAKGEVKTYFICTISINQKNDCLPFDDISKYQGKTGKIWWQDNDSSFLRTGNLLFQLEIDGIQVISYKDQKERYLLMKKRYPYINMIAFLFSMLFFILLQISNTPVHRMYRC